MYSERLIEKLGHDTPLTNLHDYLVTYDIPPMERLKRSMALIDFWVKIRREYSKLYKNVYVTFKCVRASTIKLSFLMLQFKAICDGKEVDYDGTRKYNLKDLEVMVKVINREASG